VDKNISIHDVAEMAGVSISTVSRVLNDRSRVAEKTRHAVEKAVRRLNYSPNIRGRALSLQRTDTIGLVLPDFMGDYYGRLMEGVDEAARKASYHLIVTKAKGTTVKKEAIQRLLNGGRVDGLILMVDRQNEELLEGLDRIGRPLVILDKDVGHRHLNNVLVDNRTGARDATDHLISVHQHTNLIFVGGPKDNIDSMDRADGFRDALRAAGIKTRAGRFLATDYNYISGFRVAQKLVPKLKEKKRWGIVAANDELACGIMEALIREGFRIPNQVAVVGYDDSHLARLSHPTLSSVRIPLKEIGHTAVRIILNKLREPSSECSKIILKGRLVLRHSCGCAQ